MKHLIQEPVLSQSLLSNENLAWFAIVIVCCWQNIAMNTIIYISGLHNDVYAVYAECSLVGSFSRLPFPYA